MNQAANILSRESLGLTLRRLRESKDLSQDAVAELLEAHLGRKSHQHRISELEAGKVMNVDRYIEVINVLNLTLTIQ